jgi:hypothetical protein
MKQYRVTSANFIQAGESLEPDAHMHPDDLARIKQLAGLGANLLEDYYTAGGHDPAISTPDDNGGVGALSPVGSNISVTGMEKRNLEKKHHIQPGSPEWFQLWFSRPYLTGEKPVGDEKAEKETNPDYLLDKNGKGSDEKVTNLLTHINKIKDQENKKVEAGRH